MTSPVPQKPNSCSYLLLLKSGTSRELFLCLWNRVQCYQQKPFKTHSHKPKWVSFDQVCLRPHKWLVAEGGGEPTLTLLSFTDMHLETGVDTWCSLSASCVFFSGLLKPLMLCWYRSDWLPASSLVQLLSTFWGPGLYRHAMLMKTSVYKNNRHANEALTWFSLD